MGKAGGGKSDSSGYGSGSSVAFAPIQLGARSPAKALGKKNYNEMVNGIYEIMKTYVMKAVENQGYLEQTGISARETPELVKSYQTKIDNIADQLMSSLATSVTPDELKAFPLDSFVTSSVKDIYSKAQGIFENPIMDRREIKAIVDANTSNMAGAFRQQRRQLEQEISARGLSGPAAAAARDQIERDIAAGKEDVVRQVLGTQTANKYQTQLAALGTMQGAEAQGQLYVGEQAQRWLNQYGQKLNAEQLRQAGLMSAAGLNQQNIQNTALNYGIQTELTNQPLTYLSQFAMPYFQTVGQQDIAAHSGASQSSYTQTSTSSGTTPGTYSVFPGMNYSYS